MFDQRFAFPAPSSLCRAERGENTVLAWERGQQGAFPPPAVPVAGLRAQNTPIPGCHQQDVPAAGPGWRGGTRCPLVPAGHARPGCHGCAGSCPGPASALAAVRAVSQPAVGTVAVPRAWQELPGSGQRLHARQMCPQAVL